MIGHVWRRLIAFACWDLRARAERVRAVAAEEAELYERAEIVLRSLHPDWSEQNALEEELRRERIRADALEAQLRAEREDRNLIARQGWEETDRAREVVRALATILEERRRGE